jgi:hypothetical protein
VAEGDSNSICLIPKPVFFAKDRICERMLSFRKKCSVCISYFGFIMSLLVPSETNAYD